MTKSCLSVVLAAGEGTRMRSALPKVLHKIGGLSLVSHVIHSLQSANSGDFAFVVGHHAQAVRDEIIKTTPNAYFFEQKERLGTAHAVLIAKTALLKKYDSVLITYGDTPLITPETLKSAQQLIESGVDLVVSGFYSDRPYGYGRLVKENGRLTKIVEEKDASNTEKQIKLCNGGFMAVKGEHILSLLEAVDNKNAKGEYYLTDIVSLAAKLGLTLEVLETNKQDILGVNSQKELAEAEAIWQNRKRQEFLGDGVQMQAPETVFFSFDTQISSNVFIEPNVYFGPKVSIAKGGHIRAFSYIEGAEIGEDAVVGPYARIRPQTRLAKNVKIGNFCEVKQSDISEGVKINHLTYMGDAEIGAFTNIGAGTVSCNYDGYNKEKLIIGKSSFIGSNSSLVSPLKIDEGAYIASGSVVTHDVGKDDLVFGRARQVNKPEGARRLRALFSLKKKQKK